MSDTMIRYTININNKEYEYMLERISDKITRFVCDAARVNQEFLNEDIPELLLDLPSLIEA